MNDYCENIEGSLLWHFDSEQVLVQPWGDNSLRVRVVPNGDIIAHDYALLKPEEQSNAQIEVTADGAKITNGRMTATIENIDPLFTGRQKETGRLAFYKDGQKILEEIGFGGRLKLKARRFEPLAGSYKLTMTFRSDPKEHIYGMGQYQDGLFDLKGNSRELSQRNTQASVPFYYSSQNYGFLWNNPAVGEVHFDQTQTQWVAEETDQLDYWITGAEDPAGVLKQYTAVTGRVPEMPEHGYGLWQSRMRYYNQEQVVSVAEKYHQLGIPLDVMIIDFFHWPKQGDYRFDKRFFPDMPAMTKRLKELGVKLMVSVWPQVDTQSENFDDFRRDGLLVKNNAGIPIQMDFEGNVRFLDFTNPKTQKRLWEVIKKNYQDDGVELFWLDEAEPEYTVYDYKNYHYYLGNVEQIGNIYPFYYSKTFYDGMKSQGDSKIMNLVRCAWAGSQRFGALVWSGDVRSDFHAFKQQIVAGLQMGMAGLPWWTTDTGGFHGGDVRTDSFKELLIRWFQFSTFSPVLRLHGERLPFKDVSAPDGSYALHTGADDELWSFGEQVYGILSKFVQLREALRPYLHDVMAEAHQDGAPVMRPLFYEYPDDSQSWNIKDEYLLGSELLVCPVVEAKATSRKVYLPAGSNWQSLADGKEYEGGKEYQISSPLDTLPVFTQTDNYAQLAYLSQFL
ncbi:MAG: glycoside hydrolase family 31 protein [Lactobacillus sp.]|nr:glycoside hydrolase family 31 protein [Lactobacillus sp.]